MKRVADLIGIEEAFLNRAIRSRPSTRSEAQRQALRVHKRFYVTLALHDLVHEVPLDTVARRYGASRGMLQSLQSSAATFSGMVTVFCHKLGWNNLEMLLSQFQNRLTFGIERELCDLIRISSLNAFRARVLYNAGYHSIAAVASAAPGEIEKHLRNATPFQSKNKSEGESEYELRRRMRAKCVWVNGGRALTEGEAAEEIVREACGLLKEDALKLGVTWKPEVPARTGAGNDSEISGNGAVSENEFGVREGNRNERDRSSLTCQVIKPAASESNEHGPQNRDDATTSSRNPEVSSNAVVPLLPRESSPKESNSTKGILSKTSQIQTKSLTKNVQKASTAQNSSEAKMTSTFTNTIIPNRIPSQVNHSSSKTSTQPIKRTNNQTPVKKPESSLKRKHSISKSPKDCNGPKVKPTEPSETTIAEDTAFTTKTPPRSKNGLNCQNDNFYADCLDNFKIKEQGTPRKRKAKGVLILESPSRTVPPLVKNNTRKGSRVDGKIHDVTSPPASGLLNKIEIPKEKATSSDNLVLDDCNLVVVNEARNNAIENKHRSDSIQTPVSKVKLNLSFADPSSSNTKTPARKQLDMQDESPELISSSEGKPKIPSTDVENESTSPNILVTSPELYSETLFPESPRNESSEMQVDKMSESSEFRNLDLSVYDVTGKNSKIIVKENDKMKGELSGGEVFTSGVFSSEVPGEVHTPSAVELQKVKGPEEDIASIAALCTPGMFDSEILLSPFPLETSLNLEAACTVVNSSEQREQKAREEPIQCSEKLINSPEELISLSSSEAPRGSSEQSRGTSDSFSLRLSQSFESTNDSVLSTTTLAAVAALEENEMFAKDNQDKDNEGSPGLQEVSNISLSTLAAIEAMDNELRQNPVSDPDQQANELKNADESRLLQKSPFHCPKSSVSERPFTEIKQRSFSRKPASSTEGAMSDIRGKTSYAGLALPFEVVDVAKDRGSFEMFVEGCKTNSFSFSVAVEKRQSTGSSIGRKFNKGSRRSSGRQKPRLVIEENNLTVVGIATCWENRRVCFLSLEEASHATVVPLTERLENLQTIMGLHLDCHVKMAFGVKEQHKVSVFMHVYILINFCEHGETFLAIHDSVFAQFFFILSSFYPKLVVLFLKVNFAIPKSRRGCLILKQKRKTLSKWLSIFFHENHIIYQVGGGYEIKHLKNISGHHY